ncbi:hypothetical protein GH5_05049 [Leishmania sp. Ghana 2012 LV757]|uniref:hypothetical protein n=1 Tax=Leishmania sp. Ghana 2012 LV757 TaxID=2803181 RepID=UPI001B699361|nr:hypothetical protein GH5_05049 [Leishmania sp. Ghana 2012 LV757]
MEHTPSSDVAERAPFSYARRSCIVRSSQSVADVARAADAADLHSTETRTFCPPACSDSIEMSAVADTVRVVHGDTRRCSHAETGAVQNSITFQVPFLRASQCPAAALSPVKVDSVPKCLRPLRHVHSARAWDAIAAGCVAEAKQLSEVDGDVVARAASIILGGDALRGLVLLESYVIATCTVLHEHHQGAISGALCVERHNAVMLEWLHHRTTPSADRSLQTSRCGVDPMRVTEAVMRRVVLQSMQLMDMVEMHRWYTAAVVLCTSGETHDESSSSRKGRKSTRSRKTKTGTSTSSGGDMGCCQSSVTPFAGFREHWAEEMSSSDSSAIISASVGRDTPAESAAAAPATDAVQVSDGYEAPSNLWFRYFFALCETTPADEPLATTLSRQSKQPSKACDRDPTPATPPGTTFTVPSTSAVTEGNSGSCPTGSGGEGAPGKLARTQLSFKERRGGCIARERPLEGNCENEGSRCFRTLPPAPRAVPAWASAALRPLDQEETASLLLSHCAEWDVFFITAVTAFQTQHYRTCMIAASRFLHWAEKIGMMAQSIEASDYRAGALPMAGDAGDEAGPLPSHHCHSTHSVARQSSLPHLADAPGLQEYQGRLALLVRARSSLQVGERLQFGKDVVTLLDYAEDSLSYHVGCSLALFGLPLPAARETVTIATANFTRVGAEVTPTATQAVSFGSFSTTIQRYLYVLTESVHALTLLQLGMVEPAMRVAKAALDRARALRVRGNSAAEGDEDDALLLDTLRSVVVIAATALEDATSVLEVTLSPHLLAYIAVSPAFFGGLCAGGIRVKAQSEAHRLLYPSKLPLYVSTRQMIPFHMNRAVYLHHSGQLRGAWDDACCAVAAVDEVVGSVEFAFSDCFPLRVYYFAFHVGFELLEALLSEDLEAAKACLSNPTDRVAMDRKDATLQENEMLSEEILHINHDMVRRMLYFYPRSRLTELCQVLLSIMCGERDFLRQAVLLSDRYPHSPAAQNLLTVALYFDHHIPEAVDSAAKNLQDFPHSREIIRVHRMLQKKCVVYRFDYRGVLPTLYRPGLAGDRVTKRKALLILLLAANLGLVCLTVFMNVPYAVHLSEEMKILAVRMQLPSLVPLFLAAIFFVHSIVAATSTENLISTALTDLFFVNSALNRALFCLRCIPLVNVVNALLVSFAGNNFLLESGSTTFVLYFCLTMLLVPFTTRVWFLPSVDEPDVDVMSWLAILSVDTVMAFVVVVPHIVLAVLEPYLFLIFYFYAPTPRPGSDKGDSLPSSSIRRRLLLHAHYGQSMAPRFKVGSGSCYLYIRCLKWLYYRSHSSMETRYLAESQLEAESFRVFPMIEGEEAGVLFSHVPLTPLCAALTSTELEPPVGLSPGGSVTGSLDRDADASKDHLPARANNSVRGQGLASSTCP